jgi:hypothetical protein
MRINGSNCKLLVRRSFSIILFSCWISLSLPHIAIAAPPLSLGRCDDSEPAWLARFDAHDTTLSKRDAFEAHAQQCHDEGQYAKAVSEWLKVFTTLSASDPEGFEVHIWLGIDYQRSGDAQAALREWNVGLQQWRALTPDTPNTEAGDKLFASRHYREAFASYAQGEVFSGYNPWVFRKNNAATAWYNDAVQEAVAGDFDTAFAKVRQVLHSTQDAYPAYLLYGDLLFIKGSRQAAINQWEETLRTFSADPPGPPQSRWYPSHWVALAMLREYVSGGS